MKIKTVFPDREDFQKFLLCRILSRGNHIVIEFVYEIDVPESYRNKTGQIIFATGGLLGLGAASNNSFAQGGLLGHITNLGQWQYPHEVTTIPSNNITMKGVDYPVLGVSNTGDTKYMLPGTEYLFDGNYVTEYPMK